MRGGVDSYVLGGRMLSESEAAEMTCQGVGRETLVGGDGWRAGGRRNERRGRRKRVEAEIWDSLCRLPERRGGRHASVMGRTGCDRTRRGVHARTNERRTGGSACGRCCVGG